jgi:hypothetical protein
MVDLKTHQEAIRSLDNRSLRLSYALQNFSDIRKAHKRVANPDRGGGGRTHSGLKPLEGRDIENLAIELAGIDWSGRKATSTVFRLAEKTLRWLRVIDASHKQKFDLGRLLLSAFVYAEVYRLEADDDAYDSPLYVVEIDILWWKGAKPGKTSGKPFPKWEKNIDQDGNRLVKPSWPCPQDNEYVPTLNQDELWLRAVHALESTAFRINKDVLKYVIETDKKVATRIIHKEPRPEQYKKPRELLDKRYKTDKIEKLRELRQQDKALRRKDNKANEAIKKENARIKGRNRTKRRKGLEDEPLKPLQRSKDYHTTVKQDQTWTNFWLEHKRLEKNRWRVISRRQRFEREVEWATTLAKTNKPFYQRISVDYRGRVYLPDFSYQGSDFCRAVIEFDDSCVMTKRGYMELFRHTGNTKGIGASHQEKDFFTSDATNIYTKIGVDPVGEWQSIASADSPYCFLRACLEWGNSFASSHIAGVLGYCPKILLGDRVPNQQEHDELRSIYDKAEKCVVASSEFEKDELLPSPDGQHLVSHLPIAADQKNSAFQHMALMMGDDGKALLERTTGEEDIYVTVGARFTKVEEKFRRKIAKMIIVPWSYGGTEYSCKEKVREWRRDNAGEIPFLDNLTSAELTKFVHYAFDILKDEFDVCIDYQNIVKKFVEEAQAKDSTNGIEWITSGDFNAVQRVHKTRKKPLRGKVVKSYEEEEGWLKAAIPLDEIDWRKMKTKAPPNLVHSYDAAMVHALLGQGVSLFPDPLTLADDRDVPVTVVIDPLVTVHDSYASLANESTYLPDKLKIIFAVLYIEGDPLVDFGSQVSGEKKPQRDSKSAMSLIGTKGVTHS